MAEKILLIGDHETVRSALCKRLEMAFPCYQVIETAATEEAISLVLSQSPRVVILDVGPPVVEQLEIVRRIKTVQPLVQLVVWTIHDWENYRADALAAGATAYILKEETQNKLLSVLATMLSAQPDSSQNHNDEAGSSTILREI